MKKMVWAQIKKSCPEDSLVLWYLNGSLDVPDLLIFISKIIHWLMSLKNGKVGKTFASLNWKELWNMKVIMVSMIIGITGIVLKRYEELWIQGWIDLFKS